MSWRLRKSKNAIYGPVEMAELRYWAADGRILATDEISENEGPWKPASDHPSLELDWLIARLDSPTRGPLHLRVCAELLHRRILRGDEALVHSRTGERTPLALALAAELLRSGKPVPAPQESAPGPTASQQPAPASAPSEGRGQAMLERALRDAERRNERLRALSIEQDEERQSLRRALEELQNNTSGTADQMAQLSDARDQAEARVAELASELEKLREQHNETLHEFRELNARYIQLRDEGPGANAGKPKVRLA
ncbi:MAG: hypothetical protein M9963_11065 [Kiritimatiellae bacterium]|nr:hypothetical protein [Kiritimatiellia bacterium]MCO5062511.1 hypothetical protein [Kiritimatiellia bacterium]MCO6399803.1 hypothetical protein [Verrucomicrobiota bacterium]